MIIFVRRRIYRIRINTTKGHNNINAIVIRGKLDKGNHESED